MGDLSKNFDSSELACPDCKKAHVEPALVQALQELRDLAARPIKIVSGYRCVTHNASVGGAQNSMHTAGKAADLIIEGMNVREMYERAGKIEAFKKGGIGIYPDANAPFIHVDVRPNGPSRWSKVKGKYTTLAAGMDTLAPPKNKSGAV